MSTLPTVLPEAGSTLNDEDLMAKEHDRQMKAQAALERLGLAGQMAVKTSKYAPLGTPNVSETSIKDAPVRVASGNTTDFEKAQVTFLSRIWTVLNRVSGTLDKQLEYDEDQALETREEKLESSKRVGSSPIIAADNDNDKNGGGLGGMVATIAAALGPALMAALPAILAAGAGAAVANKLGIDAPSIGSDPDPQTPQKSSIVNPFPEWNKGGGLVGFIGRKTGAYHWYKDESSPDEGQDVLGNQKSSQYDSHGKGGLSLTPRERQFVREISKHESARGDPHEAVFGYGKYGKPKKKLTDMTVAEVQDYQDTLRANTKRAGIGKINGKVLGTSAVGIGQFVEGTMNATLAWMAKKGMIPRDWRHMKFDAALQDKMLVANAARLGADPNKVDSWGRKEKGVIKSQWESYTGRNDRVSTLVKNVKNARGNIEQTAQDQTYHVNTPKGVGMQANSTQSETGKTISGLVFGGEFNARKTWARSKDLRNLQTPSLTQTMIKPEPAKNDNALTSLLSRIVGGNKGQRPPVGVDSTGNVPSPSADLVSLSYQLYFHTGPDSGTK